MMGSVVTITSDVLSGKSFDIHEYM